MADNLHSDAWQRVNAFLDAWPSTAVAALPDGSALTVADLRDILAEFEDMRAEIRDGGCIHCD